MIRRVTVASFSPAGEDGGVGGFHWSIHYFEAAARYSEWVREAQEDGQHVVRLVKVCLPEDLWHPGYDATWAEQVTDWMCDGMVLDQIESGALAEAEYVPPGAVNVPVGGVLP